MSGTLILRLVLFALPLGLDTFALSTLLGVTPLPARVRLRLALTFAAAEGVMPAVGLLLGLPLGGALGVWSGYLAGALIAGIGLWMWRKEWSSEAGEREAGEGKRGVSDEKDGGEGAKITRAARAGGWVLLGLALSVSLDELAAGFSFGVFGFPLVPALAVIALQALLVSLLGQWVGRHAGERAGEAAERLAGPALCLLGLWFLLATAIGLPT